MSLSQKNFKTIKIKKRVKASSPTINESTKQKSLKIARKFRSIDPCTPDLLSPQADFQFEGQESPLIYLSNPSFNEKYEVIQRNRSISPTDLIGEVKRLNYSNFIQCIRKPSQKFHSKFSKLFNKPVMPSLQDQLSERDKILKSSISQVSNKSIQSPDKFLMKQTKSLENYLKKSEYWQKLEQNFADTLEKNPEDLRLNSGKAFIAKKKEMDEIEKFNKINEISETGFWKQSLRNDLGEQKFFRRGTEELKNSLRLKKDFNKVLRHSPKPVSRNFLKSTDYFQEKLKSFNKYTEEVVGLGQSEELVIQGVDKIKLEYDAVKKIGQNYVNLPPLEPYTDQLITKNYDAKILY